MKIWVSAAQTQGFPLVVGSHSRPACIPSHLSLYSPLSNPRHTACVLQVCLLLCKQNFPYLWYANRTIKWSDGWPGIEIKRRAGACREYRGVWKLNLFLSCQDWFVTLGSHVTCPNRDQLSCLLDPEQGMGFCHGACYLSACRPSSHRTNSELIRLTNRAPT